MTNNLEKKSKTSEGKMSRRDLFKFLGAAAITTAGAGMLGGCTPPPIIYGGWKGMFEHHTGKEFNSRSEAVHYWNHQGGHEEWKENKKRAKALGLSFDDYMERKKQEEGMSNKHSTQPSSDCNVSRKPSSKRIDEYLRKNTFYP